MRGRNYYVNDADTERLKTLKEEYESMGRHTKIEGNRLTVFARHPKRAKKDKREERPRRRDKE